MAYVHCIYAGGPLFASAMVSFMEFVVFFKPYFGVFLAILRLCDYPGYKTFFFCILFTHFFRLSLKYFIILSLRSIFLHSNYTFFFS